MFNHISRWRLDFLWRLWYPLLTRLTRDSAVTFLNYGYAGDANNAPSLAERDEPDRPCIQLYDHVARAVDLQSLDVLEVSCGHGGGASYIARYLKPRSMHAIDRNAQAVALCRRRHRTPGLTFSRGDALALRFPAAAFDAVLNVEASHCYPDMPRFFREVQRVLRPGGHFLYADFRVRDECPGLHEQLRASGLQVLRREDISAGVLRGMRLNNAKYLDLIERLVPGPLRKVAKRFAGVEGSAIYNELQSGESLYFLYVLRKPT